MSISRCSWHVLLMDHWISHRCSRSGGFIPPREIRELRDLPRTRRKLVEAMTAEKNRVQKVLEDANIKISSVVSKVFGVSSLNMIGALLERDTLSADEIAEMARGKLKKKVNQLVKALNGQKSGWICQGFLMRRISLHGLQCVLATMRARERKK